MSLSGNLEAFSENFELSSHLCIAPFNVIARKSVLRSGYRLVLDCGVALASLESSDSMPCATDLTT